jgi:hypothetical protein
VSAKAWKWVIYILPLLLFTFLLNTGPLLKRPMGRNDHLAESLHVVQLAVGAERWDDAGMAWQQAHVAMESISRRIEIATERDELQDFYEELARLRGSIEAHERGPALTHLAVLNALFDEFGH